MTVQKKVISVGLTLFLLFVTSSAAIGADKAANNDNMVNIDFKDADIKVVIRAIAELSGKNFIIDDKVKGKVTIVSPRKVTKEEAMKVFESTMEVYGYSLIEAGAVIKVIPVTEARQRGGFKSGPKQPGDRMMTRLIPLKNVKAQDMVNALRPMVPPTSFITAYQNTNTIIIADFESNIAKIMRIIKKLDSPVNQESITVVHLSYAGAKELASKLQKIYKNGAMTGPARSSGRPQAQVNRPAGQPPGPISSRSGPQSAPRIIADERINAIIVVAAPSFTQQILSLITQLDIAPPPGRGGINVYYLKNADAEEIAKVLGNITQKAGAQRPGPPLAPGQGLKLSGSVNITPDKATNSLVITASVEDFETMKGVIEKLDIRRRQVFVEALIMEITTSKTAEFGVEWRTTKGLTDDGPAAIGGVDFGGISAVAENPLAAPAGLTIGVVDGIFSFGGKEFVNIGALVHALQSDSDINILSTPNILTNDNEEAEIVVAQNVPFVTGQSQNTGGTTLTTIERKNIGLTLRITPQISESDNLKLDVYQEISNISTVQLEKAQDLITNTRSIKTSVTVKDRQNVVLGGLINDDVKAVESKVPFIGDIPLLGWLFKSSKRENAKTNLLIFLTPHIINNDSDIRSIRKRKEAPFEESADFSKRMERVRKLNIPSIDDEEGFFSE